MPSQVRIGIDFGGTKIEAIALDAQGAVLARERCATPRGDYARTLATIGNLVSTIEARFQVRATVGVGMPGAISPATGLVKNANSTWCIGRALDRDLSQLLGREVRVSNDANCLAVSEAADGAAAGAHVVFGIILGTGVGGGIAIDGKPLIGRHAIGGEWGHNPLPWPRDAERPGPLCYCGKYGCIETFASGPGFAADHESHTGERVSAKALIEQVDAGQPAATASWARYVDRLARGLAHVINVIDPDVIVVGGGLSNATLLYTDVPARLGAYAFSDRIDTPIRRAMHGDSSGVRGAAWLW